MLRRVHFIPILLFVSGIACAQDSLSYGKIVLEGAYEGKNIYIQNPYASNDTGFCTVRVLVNGVETKDDISSSAYEIDLRGYGFSMGDKIKIEIFHKKDCKPKVLNPEPGPRKSTFECTKISVDPDGTLRWTTTGETGKLPFVVETFVWNKWVKIGEVDGKGGAGPNEYTLRITPHSSVNQLRVKQFDYSSQPNYSKPVKFCQSAGPELKSSNFVRYIEFSGQTLYELYDRNGNIVKRGFGSSIDCSGLQDGSYFLNYDNRSTGITKSHKSIKWKKLKTEAEVVAVIRSYLPETITLNDVTSFLEKQSMPHAVPGNGIMESCSPAWKASLWVSDSWCIKFHFNEQGLVTEIHAILTPTGP
jgi:hypothetical protein